jgi:mono/diheme cytochrome c family protein
VHAQWKLLLPLAGVLLVFGFGLIDASAFDLDKPNAKIPNYYFLDVQEPRFLSSQARRGKKFYEAKCLSCHGQSGRGSKNGPPLIVYEKDHHSDETFKDAIRKGVPQHHWKYGDMPPIEGTSERDIANLIAYVRAVQTFQDKQEGEE